MTVFVSVDDSFGILFNQRRVSRDSAIIKKISEMCDTVTVSEYSAPLFAGVENVYVSPSPMTDNTGFLFIEKEKLLPFISEVEKIVLFKFGKKYPADTFLDVIPTDASWQLEESEEFCGTSHEKITMEIWKK